MGCAAAHPIVCAMFNYPQKVQYSAGDLIEIIRLLRDPVNGCPWDRVQTHASIRMNFLEEAYEAVDAIDLNDAGLLCEELGDVLMQVVFHARIEEEQGHFDFGAVCDGVCRKLLARHPNIFAGDPARQGINDWDVLKNMEKGRTGLPEDLASVPAALPALMRAAKLQKRAARYGAAPVPETAAQELARSAAVLQTAPAGSKEAEQAAGRLLFAAVTMAQAAETDPEKALQRQNAAFAAAAGPR